MDNQDTDSLTIHPITFSPDVLARISPELSLQRHLALGFRPSLRAFEEFRDVQVNEDELSRYGNGNKDSNIIGSNVLKSGETFVVTTIMGGIIEELTASREDGIEGDLLKLTQDNSAVSRYTSVYPVVEVERGRVGACTDEEMALSQKLYNSVLRSKLLPKMSLKVNPGVRITDEKGEFKIIYPDDDNTEFSEQLFQPNRNWQYLLYAKIVVYSRTGPVFPLCWNSLMYALQSTKLPKAFIDERAIDLKMTVRTKGRSTTVKETYDILCDPTRQFPLKLREENIGFASNYGIVDTDPESQLNAEEGAADGSDDGTVAAEAVLLADIDTESEETSINTTISIINDSRGNMKSFTALGGSAKITPDMIKRSIKLSTQRALHLKEKNIVK
ncbi:exosome non-catalytic core subunit RRP43 KNAG_0C00850 [Huiozyma naganishii CBS 8797]|uniref:Ribosomal RNA-processing protein 43 n=1 Tax=Huiozyma naganishii (strain ATCC MYA-139 / BCRC 22969 / CBS 8797 / KCTC 17520 / NBRC 10181 / NCYC 3082 / Yp74L-3) TaxID=1071383 RepID=J7RI28_HUIN7|nr:hypothetical protein KNAG_0C00850 [Kazachstania naganishii CBS 8797]CCK69198.1 hypothetical protein KNAG_0C00850 [Kazachstania naganishii CBS 8797]